MSPRLRTGLADAAGLSLLLLLLADYLRPELLLTATIPAGGDTPCHYPTFLYLRDYLLGQHRLHGWYPGAYLGHPTLLYYFPFPFLLMCVLSLVMPAPVAFKLGTVGGVFLLPLLTYASFRLMRFRFPSPLLAAAGSVVFLFIEENPIWGGTIASTLVGEFSYTYGLAFAVLFLGVVYRAYSQGRGFWLPAALLALTALAHGYAVLWAGLAAGYFLYAARRPWRTLAWTAAVGGIAFALAAFWLLPLLVDWRYTTPYADPWIKPVFRNLFPPHLWVLAGAAVAGITWTLVYERRAGGADHRLLFLGHAALVALALAAAGPAAGVIDIRFIPFAHASVAMLGAAWIGLMLSRLRSPAPLALAAVLFTAALLDGGSHQIRAWSRWNFSGLEAKELWPEWDAVARRLHGTVGDPRVAVEYSRTHERVGSIRMYETLPFFSGRSTIEGVYNQASLSTHPIYYLTSELGASSPNPFRSRYYSKLDTDAAVAHLRLFNARDVVALSETLAKSLESRRDAALLAKIPPYSIFRLDGSWGYVTPMTHEPVRSSPDGWREKAYRWFTRKPLSPAHLVFTDDTRFAIVEGDPYLAPAAMPLPAAPQVDERLENERLTVKTSRPGHPLLVKISYHPRWKAEGARGPYLVSPSLMMIVPERETIVLTYSRTWADVAGAILTVFAALAAAAWRFRPRPVVEPARLSLGALACDSDAKEPRRWGGLLPGGVVAGLLLLGLVSGGSADGTAEATKLHEYASRAYQEERFEAAAEYLRNALVARPEAGLRRGVLALRAESLLRAGRAAEALAEWKTLLEEQPAGPYAAQGLFGVVAAAGAGAPEAADAAGRLLRQHADTPWAARLQAEFPQLTEAARVTDPTP
jgi:hypothetical protein